MALTDPAQLMDEKRHLGGIGLSLITIGGTVGAVSLMLTFLLSFFFEHGTKHFMFSYLHNFMFFLSFTLGAMFFVILQYLSGAGWSIAVRRVAEILSRNLIILAVLFIPIILGMGYLFKWTNPEVVATDPLVAHKVAYLNIPFFLARVVIYFVIWGTLAWFYMSNSLKQDQTGDHSITSKLTSYSPISMILLALTLTFASFDWMMSLDPHWFSTIFGVYFLAGSLVSFFSLMTVVFVLLQSQGILANAITREHYHDFGKFMFGFTVFWAYIAFSQYMLYWYANMPETTGWFLRRQTGDWGYISIILILGHFVIPFFGLISRYPKRRKYFLLFWAIWILLIHWVDLYWIIMPEFGKALDMKGVVPFNMIDVGCFIGFLGLYVGGFALFARGKSLIPEKDPRIAESLNFENA